MKIRTEKGFSLIELMIVIAILGIVLAIAAPSYNKYVQNNNLKTAARGIAADISMCKQKAMAESIHYKIVFSKTDNNYKIEKGNAAGDTDKYDVTNAIEKKLSSYGTITIDDIGYGTSNQVIFDPRGTTTGGHIDVINSYNKKMTITTSIMGRVHVEIVS